MLLYRWLNEATNSRGTAKALVYRDTYLSWRGLQHRVERRAQEFAAMGIERGHWVGLMLGNVPDFAILALALSKLGATVVPLDPTTGVRDLTLFLEAAPLRALITRPRGGNELPSATLPFGTLQRGRRGMRLEPESRRRLQGTLLTCSIYRRDDSPPADAEVVLITADSSGDPKGVRALFNRMLPLLNFQAVFRMAMTKEVLRRRGVISHTHVRAAGPRLDDGDRRELDAMMAEIADILPPRAPAG
mgnify:CR=1 FL=1